jgi:hypothetical protein
MVGDVVSQRLAGGRPSRLRAFVVSAVAGVAIGAAAYKLLRSGGNGRQQG